MSKISAGTGGGTVRGNGALPHPTGDTTKQLGNLESIGNYPETFGQTLFAVAVLSGIGITPTHGAIAAFVGWEKQEGGHWHNKAKHNPLNTTYDMPGAGNTGTQGNIKVYKSWAQGISATVHTLQLPAYAAVRQSLKGNDQKAIANAVVSSPWGTKNAAAITGTTWGDIQKSWVNGINPNDPFDPTALPGQVAGAAAAAAGAAATAVGGAVDAAASLPKTVSEIWHTISSGTFWLRVGQVLLGAIALIAGVVLIAREYSPMGDIATALQTISQSAGKPAK